MLVDVGSVHMSPPKSHCPFPSPSIGEFFYDATGNSVTWREGLTDTIFRMTSPRLLPNYHEEDRSFFVGLDNKLRLVIVIDKSLMLVSLALQCLCLANLPGCLASCYHHGVPRFDEQLSLHLIVALQLHTSHLPILLSPMSSHSPITLPILQKRQFITDKCRYPIE